MNILITICARAGSKGIPGKNIKILNGIPLIKYTITKAIEFAKNKNVEIALSSDDSEIISIFCEAGLSTKYKRPKILSRDNTGKIETIKDLVLFHEDLNNKIFDFILDLDVTSPLRSLVDLEFSFKKIIDNKEALSLFSVNSSSRSPYFNMVEKDENGYFSLVKNSNNNFLSRQKVPKVYDLNASFYWYRRSFFNGNYKTPITEKSIIYLIDHICFDLDDPIDFDYMEYLIQSNKLDFEL